MKRTVSVLLALSMVLALGACKDNSNNSNDSIESSTENTSVVTATAPIKIVNHMTEEELSRVNTHALTLLDKPEIKDPMEQFNNSEHTLQIEFKTYTKEYLLSSIEAVKDQMPEEDYQESVDAINELEDDYTEEYPEYFLLDGQWMSYMSVFAQPYEGGSIDFTSRYDDGTEEEHHFDDLDGYLDYVKADCISDGKSQQDAELTVAKTKLAVELYVSGNYEKLPEGSVDLSDPALQEDPVASDYRTEWEYDREEVEQIRDSIDEISIYDEELDTDFLVHVVLPPSYDPDKSYPVFFLTDGVWRFGNAPELRKTMENGEASDVIIVTLGYDYSINGADGNTRFGYLVPYRDKLLDFITDNLMPYLGENYNIDYAESTLYGHSDGGVFAHYALMNSDRYENQPFGRYIIGSPAFWGLYNDPEIMNLKGYQNDYGYWERNDSMDKHVFLCGGSQEDPDYAEKYNGNKTTLEGLEALNEDLESHGADVEYKLYDSHHYQYIPDMLVEYLKATYPAT